MARQSANRPTNTDISPYLIDFTGVDFGNGAPQQPQQEEPGFLTKLVNSGSAILEGLGMIPGGIVDTVRDAWAGGDIDVTEKADLERRAQKEREREAYARKYQGKTFEGVTDAMNSLPYSIGTMGASLGAGIATSAVAGPVAGAAAGMAASGTLAYRATKQDFLRRMLGETEKALGRMPTQEEWNRIAAEFDSEATEFGLWEAGPEALSNLFMAKLLGPLGSKIFKGGLGQAAKRGLGLYGEEFGTETGTRMGQGKVEAELGLIDHAPSAWEAFKEIAPATFWQTTLMAGGKKAADLVSNRLRRRAEDVKDDQKPESPFMDAGSVQPAAPYVFEQQTENMPVPRGAARQNPVQDYLDEMSHADTDNFIREQEEKEQARADADFLIEQGRAPSVRYTPHQQALEAGETIDLLQLPQDALGMAQGIRIFGLPEGVGAQAMPTNDTGLGTIAPPTDFYASQPITTPYQPKQALPRHSGTSAGPGHWAGGRSQLSYPWGGVAQGIGGVANAQQPLPVTPPGMPTQSQITNTQVAPRSDTTEMAESLGLPAPEAMPQEAGPAPAAEVPLPATPQGMPAITPMQGLGSLVGLPGTATQFTEANNGGEEQGPEGLGIPGLQPGDGGRPAPDAAGDATGAAGGRLDEGGRPSAQAAEGSTRRAVKIPNRPDEAINYEVLEADDVQASHIPEAGFLPNPRYQLENERRYHDEPDSQAKVLNHAQKLDPDFLIESVGAEHGAPVIDRQGNVLGGNGRAMSVRMAYEKFPQKAAAYRQALMEKAASLGLDPAQIARMKRPLLVRRLARDMDAAERQALVSALNDSFTDSKNARAAGKSRGDRLSRKTLEALAYGLAEAKSLRDYFDQAESANVVEMLIEDGVIQATERNALMGRDGLLNPDGKKVVEQALRGRVARTYEALDALPTPILGKLDAAIPRILVAENVGGEWDITNHVRDAIDLLAEFQGSDQKSPETFLDLGNMEKGGAPSDRYSQQAQALFMLMLNAKKNAFVEAFAKYAGQAKLSQGPMNLGMSAQEAGEKFLGFKPQGKRSAEATPAPDTTAQPEHPKAAPEGKAGTGATRRTELINSLPKEQRAEARRMTNAELERFVETWHNPVPFTEENFQDEELPFYYNMPNPPAGTVFVMPSGLKSKPFPKTDYSTEEKGSASKKKVNRWIDEFVEADRIGAYVEDSAQQDAAAERVNEESARATSATEQFRKEMPLVTTVETGVIHKTEDMTAIEAAQRWISENVSSPVQTKMGEVEVDAGGIKDSLSHGFSGPKLDAVQAIVPVLEHGEYLGELSDKNGKPIENYFFAGRVKFKSRGQEDEKIVFVRTRKAAGGNNRFYVHEVFTEEDIKEAAGARGVTDQDRPFQGAAAFYKHIIARYLQVKEGSENPREPEPEAMPTAARAPDGTVIKSGAFIKHNGAWHVRYVDGTRGVRIGKSFQSLLEDEWRDAEKQGHTSDAPEPEPPLERWSVGRIRAEVFGGSSKYSKMGKPELIKAARRKWAEQSRTPIGRNQDGKIVYINGDGQRHLDPKDFVSGQPAIEKDGKQVWADADDLYRMGERGQRFLTAEEIAARKQREKENSAPKDLFANVVNEDRIKSLTDSEIDLINAMFDKDKKGKPNTNETGREENGEPGSAPSQDSKPETKTEAESLAPPLPPHGLIKFSFRDRGYEGDKGTWASFNSDTRQLTVQFGDGIMSEAFIKELGAFCEKYGIDFMERKPWQVVEVFVPEEKVNPKPEDTSQDSKPEQSASETQGSKTGAEMLRDDTYAELKKLGWEDDPVTGGVKKYFGGGLSGTLNPEGRRLVSVRENELGDGEHRKKYLTASYGGESLVTLPIDGAFMPLPGLGGKSPEGYARYIDERLEKWGNRPRQEAPEGTIGEAQGKKGENSYGIPLERVTEIDRPFSMEEAREALDEISGVDLPNILEGLTAQVNSQQRDKLLSGKAAGKSQDNGFDRREHNALAAKIASAWKWAAEAGRTQHKSSYAQDTTVRRFVAALKINGSDAFAWLTVKESPNGLRIYSAELVDEKKLRGYIDERGADAAPSPLRSFEEIIAALNGPVKSDQSESAAQPKPAKPNYGTQDDPNTFALSEYFAEKLGSGHSYSSIVQARKEAGALLGDQIKPGTIGAKAIDEAIELGAVQAARTTVEDMRAKGASDVEIFRALVDLYQRQPTLGTRTSTSIAQQAYSTPVPIAFLASRLAHIVKDTTVYEPTAGNGALLIEATPRNVTANELNRRRARHLKKQGFTVTEHDAVEFAPATKVDVVIENPPFGRVWNENHTATQTIVVGDFSTKEIDQAIVVRSLQALKGNGKGRAVLIIGGKQGGLDARKKGYRSAAQVKFWGWLFNNYHVLEHFSIDGNMYSRQGASFPIDVIVLDMDGTSAGRTFPGAQPPRMFTSFESLEELFNGTTMGDAGSRERGDTGSAAGLAGDGSQEDVRTEGNPGLEHSEVASGDGRPGGHAGGKPGGAAGNGQRGARGASQSESGAGNRAGADSQREPGGNREHADGRHADGEAVVLVGQRVPAEDHDRGPGRVPGKPGVVGNERGNDLVGKKGTAKEAQKATTFQTPYQKTSAHESLGTLVPKNMATAIRKSMAELEKAHGNIDDYVARELGYPASELGQYFAAEQIDAIGLAIHNLSQGAGFIIGDQTGVGKGRVNAAIIRWAKRQGLIPVFVTRQTTLYGDMIRDLADIGMEGFTPLPTNNGLTGKNAIPLPDGRTLRTASPAKHEKVLREVMEKGLGDYDAIFTTYDQMQSNGEKPTPRRDFLKHFAPKALFILDESHSAGGSASGKSKSASDKPEPVSSFVRGLLQESPNGVFYSSATYAKTPQVMDLYMKTDMRHAVNDISALGAAISNGGIPMQQVVAAQLAEAGQYIRRERTWEGADVETETARTDTSRADACGEALHTIMLFDRAKQKKVEDLNDTAAEHGGVVLDKEGANESAMQTTNFASTMHNLISQSLLAQKVDAVVDAADAALKRGEKPVIALSNTMGSATTDYAEENHLRPGDPIDITFKELFLRYLENARQVTVKDAQGVKTTRPLTDEELGPVAAGLYREAKAKIMGSGLGNLPLSTIDLIKEGLQERGYTVGEITGRTVGIDYSGETPVLARRDASNATKARVIDGFNNGGVDAIILNSSGSTGISLHASERFNDQRRRTMIIAQPDLNIDTFMQTLGRIFRTGQVVPPKYILLFTDIPAEKRPAAILAKKMASLNANTTAARKSDASFRNIPDFLNKYGDAVAASVIHEEPELHARMGSPLNSLPKNSVDGAMRKLTGYIPLLPVQDQARLYALLESEYNDLIAQHEALGTLDLEAKPKPLDAILESEQEIVPAKDGAPANSPFAAPVKLGTYNVKRLGKPLPAAKVREMVEQGKAPDVEEQEERFRKWLDERLKRINSDNRNAFAERQTHTLGIFKFVMGQFRPGVPVAVIDGPDGSLVPGIVTNVYQKGMPDNPLALSTWKVEAAVADASKKLVFSFSQIAKQDDSGLVFRPRSDMSADDVYAALEAGQSESRETVHIATGNILAAYEQLGKGKVIQFEDHEGNIIPGLELPKGKSLKDILDALDIPLSPEQAMEFLYKGDERFAAVKTADKNFLLTRTGEDSFTIAVPASKAKGAAYYLNGGILKAAGRDFAKVGKSMVLKDLTGKQTRAILDLMSSQGFGFVADNNKDIAREITGQRKVEPRQMASISPAEYLRHHLPSEGMRADSVRSVVSKLGEQAKNAAESRVVQSFEELPEHIRERFADEETTLEGVFDPSTGQVWFVAENLSDAERVGEVWAHEQIVHHGLRGMLTEAERKSILNRLWFSMGGMGNASIREVARTYGLDPRASETNRLTVMEEVVASLAEKRRLNELTPKEMTFWKRIVRALARAWERIVRAVAGGDYAVAHKADVDGLLTALGRYVMDGIPAGGSIVAPGRGEVFASVGTPASADIQAAHAAWRQLERDMEAWGRQVDAFDPSKVGSDGQRSLLTVGNTPDVLRKLGAPELPMTMTAKNLAKILSGDADHNLPKDLVKQLPRALAEPIMVFESATMHDAFVILTEMKHEGRSVMAAVHLDTEHQHIRINNIASVYKRGNEWWYLKQMEDGRLLYQDKKKSLAWARTNGLQLPKVRKLPARLPGGKLLTEADVVKPIKPAGHEPGNTPLASLSLKGILGMGVKDAAEAADAPEIQHLFRKSDLTFLQSIVQLPHWIAKQAKEFAAIYDRQLQRMDERSATLKKSLETVPSLFGKSRLTGPDLESLKKLLWKIEGREMWQEHVSQVDKFITRETLPNGRKLIEVNPKFYEVFKKALDAEDATPRAKEAMLEIRKSLDKDLVHAHNRMASMSEMSDDAIREFRQSIGQVPNYFPHHRYGAYFVQAKVGGEVVFRQHFDAISDNAAMAKARKIVMEQRENYPDAKWTDGKNDRLPDEILGAPIDSKAMEQIIRAATSKIGDKERAREISDLLTEGVADVLKSRGWGSHGIRRKGTPGFETDDIARVLYDYKAGLTGWLTKMEAARDFSAALSKIDARKQPNLWKYASQYTRDMLRNSDRVDRITGNIKSVAFAWYLGGNIKTAVVNATQNLVVGVPRLQMDVTGGGLMWLKGAQDAIVNRVTGNKGRGLSDDEARLIEELYGESVITDAFMEEVRGQLSGVTGASLWNKFTKILGLPMSEIERFNRASLALAAYRAARNGKLKEKAKKKYGIEGKATYEQAKEFASEVVRDAHFVYGKSNMPEFMRSNTAGRAMASMYTFRTFSHNMLAMWAWALKTQGREGAEFCAKSIGATMALGGVTALPLYATLMALFQAVTGDDDDWTETIRNYLPQNNLLRDAVCYGAPAIAGVSIGGSLKMETPLTRGLSKGKNPKEVLTDSIGEILGIPYDLGIVKVSNVMDAQASGNYWRMIEEAMPTFIKNGMQAWRLYNEGQTTMRGRPINNPGKEGARKLSGSEAVGKALGFQPVSSTKSYEAYAASKRRDEVRSAKLDELTVLALKTHDTGDPAGRRQAIKEIAAWNGKMRQEGKPHMTIKFEDVMRRVKARRRENRVSDKQREKGARQAEVWGI